MITCCPNCGAVNSLDSLLAGEGSAELVQAALEFDAAIGKAAIPYIGLFRPAKSRLTHKRAAKLLNELLPDIQAGQIQRNGQTHAAPPEAWIYAFQMAIDARNAGRLKTPLKSHGYLYEIIAGWRGQGGAVAARPQPINPQAAPPAKPSQTVAAAASMQGMKK